MRLSDIAHQSFVVHGETLDDIKRAKANGQIAFVASLEAATAIENEVDRLDILYGLGIRSSGIAYSEANALGSGLREAHDGGLTEFGRQAVRRMNKLGIAIDISHSGDQTSLDTIEASEKPIFITHAGARALWDTKRMKPDKVIKACADKGGGHRHRGRAAHDAHPEAPCAFGRVGHGACRVLRRARRRRPRRTRSRHPVRRSRRAPSRLQRRSCRPAGSTKASGSATVPYVKGMENPGEAMRNGIRWLAKHGYSDADVRKIAGGNALRVLKETWVR